MITELFPARLQPAAGATLFFTGWGMDADPFLSSLPADRDCILCHSYSRLDFDPQCVRRYSDLLVVGWSMGVWAAAHALPGHGLRIAKAIAVNGTMHPVDDDLGIPRAVFAGTLAGLTPASLAKFHRRMCASPEVHARFLAAPPQRDFADVHDELRAIAAAAEGAPPGMKWDCAVIGSGDRVFPAANQIRAWEGTPVVTLRDGHFLSSWHAVLNGGIAP